MSAQLSLDDIEATRDPVLAAYAFVRQFPEAYGHILKWALRDQAEGTRCSMHLYLALLRKYHWIERGKRPYLVSNNWSRPLVDILLADHPELADSFERRGGAAHS